MRIVQLGDPDVSGGPRISVDELGQRYADAGHHVLVVVPGDRDAARTAGRRTVVTIESPRVPGTGGSRTVIDVGVVRRVVGEFDPDAVELWDRTTSARAVLGRRRGPAPVVLLAHERPDGVLGSQQRGSLPGRRSSERRDRWLLERVDAVVCGSNHAAAELRRANSDARIVRIPLGVDLATFRPPRPGAPSTGARGTTVPTLVHAGRLSPEKQPQVAIDAVRRLRARGIVVRLVVVGSGPLDRHLREAALGLPVEFVGQVGDRAELAWHLGAADIAVATGPFERSGLAVLEAMACGTPVVVPPSGALRELVAIGAGVVAAPHPDGFADAVAALLTGDRWEQRRLARARAEEFGWDRAAQCLLDLHRRLAGTPGQPVDAPSAADSRARAAAQR